MAVSFLTGRIVYISEQAGVLLRCKRDVFRGARFSELLAPQDVGVFYGSTTPSRLPTWGTGTSAGVVPYSVERTESFRVVGSSQPRTEMALCSLPFPSVLGSGLKDFTQEKSVFCRIR